MKPAPFDYCCPDSVAEAVEVLAANKGEAKVMAGGQSLGPMLNFRVVRPALIVDVSRLLELDYVRQRKDGGLSIGALTRHRELETSALVVAGVSVEHPVLQKYFEILSKIALDTTYNCACYAFALDAAISQLLNDAGLAAPSQKLGDDASIGENYRQRLEAAVKAIVSLRRGKEGDWNYTKDGSRFDNSNSQFAVLGLVKFQGTGYLFHGFDLCVSTYA